MSYRLLKGRNKVNEYYKNQFQYQEQQEMLSNISKDQAQQLARKHGKALNQKSSFNNLLKGKIHRTEKKIMDKENESIFIATDSLAKSSNAINQSKQTKNKQKSSPSTKPLSKTQLNGKIEKTYEYLKKNLKTGKSQQSSNESMIQNSQLRLKTYSDYSQLVPLSLKIVHQNKMVNSSSMTEQCYYQKQLQIKVQLLKKQRDRLWDSITDIVRQNQNLKETLHQLTHRATNNSQTQTEIKKNQAKGLQTDKPNTSQQGFQTEILQNESCQIQTEINQNESEECQTQTIAIGMKTFQIQTEVLLNSQWCQTQLFGQQIDCLAQRYQKALLQKQQVLQYCQTLYLQDISQELSQCLNMKDAVNQYLSMKLDNLIKQFQSEKTMLQRIYEQYINQFKRNQQQLLEKNQGLVATIQEIKSNTKRLQQNLIIYEQKNISLEEENQIMSNQLNQAEQTIIESKRQAEYIKLCLQNEKQRWQQKKKTYSFLLAQSHKTINNLMVQMRQFQGLASSAHYKHLKQEKNNKQ